MRCPFFFSLRLAPKLNIPRIMQIFQERTRKILSRPDMVPFAISSDNCWSAACFNSFLNDVSVYNSALFSFDAEKRNMK